MLSDSRAVVRVHEEAGVFVVMVSGEVDADDRDLLHAAWDEADEVRLPVTAVDLSAVTFADSTILDVLLGAQDRHHRDGRAFILTGPLANRVHSLFAVTGTLAYFTFAASVQRVIDQTDPGA
ncbi:STAS domain-containing protein [Streptomyces sp. SID5770]|nr:STAS domain-containing protein [Streptomyces sp. SID5770]MZE56467.1 STAS domain-containing protein [Streptomyces sp. SID5770]